jgi:hypothetical protein
MKRARLIWISMVVISIMPTLPFSPISISDTQLCAFNFSPNYTIQAAQFFYESYYLTPYGIAVIITMISYILQIVTLRKNYNKQYFKLIWYSIAQMLAYFPQAFYYVYYSNYQNVLPFYLINIGVSLPASLNGIFYIAMLGKAQNRSVIVNSTEQSHVETDSVRVGDSESERSEYVDSVINRESLVNN